jgi:Cupin domain.
MEIKNWKNSSPHISHGNGVEYTIFVRKNTDAAAYYGGQKTPRWGAACMENLAFLECGWIQPGGKLEEHVNEYYEEIYFIIKGTGIMLFEKKEYKISEGDTIYLPKTSSHGIINNSQDFINYLVFGAGEKHPDYFI